ncbi:MAG: translocation/assembly module TamB domain-containing protein [Nonlabens sp.]
MIFLLLLFIFIRSPWGQDLIVGRLIKYVEGKTGTNVDIDKLYITFDGNIELDGLYLEDEKGDTLVYSRQLEASIPLLPIIRGNGISIEEVDWDGLKARVSRTDTIEGFNFDFLVDAFQTAPDTTQSSTTPDLTLGDFNFSNFDIILDDQVGKLTAIVNFERLTVSVDSFDLETLNTKVNELTIQDAELVFKDLSTPKGRENSNELASRQIEESSSLPSIILQAGSIENTSVVYVSKSQGMDVNSTIGDLTLGESVALIEDTTYRVSSLALKNSDIAIQMVDQSIESGESSEVSSFEWPEFIVEGENLLIENSDFYFSRNGATVEKGVFNPDVYDFDDINLQASQAYYRPADTAIKIESLTAYDASGIYVGRFSVYAQATDNSITVRNLDAVINKNRIAGNARMTYSSMQQFIENPMDFGINARLPNFKVDLKDIYRFQPTLQQNEYFNNIAQRIVSGTINVSGDTQQLDIRRLDVNWGDSTSIDASGSVAYMMSPDEIKLNLPSINLQSSRADITQFVDEKSLGISLPETLQLTGSVNGGLENISTNALLNTSYGDVSLNGTFSNAGSIAFNAAAKTMSLDLGKMLDNPSLGQLDLTIDGKGSGTSLNNLDATLDTTVESFTYNNYEIKDLPIDASFKNGSGELNASYKDDNINARLQSNIVLDTVATQAAIDLDIKGLDMQELGITNQNVKSAGRITAVFTGNTQKYEVKTSIEDGVAVFDEQSYLLGQFDAHAFVDSDTTSVQITNRILDLNLESNTDPQNLFLALQRHVDRYLTTEVALDTIQPVTMVIDGDVRPTPLLRDVILPQLEALDTLHIGIDFNEQQRKLDTDIVLPYVKYAGIELDSLAVTTRSDSVNLDFDFGFKHLAFQPVDIQRTKVAARVAGNVLNLDFTTYDGSDRLMHFGSSLSRKRDVNGINNLVFNLSLEDLILKKKEWSVPETNEMAYGEQKIKFKDFRLTTPNQSLELRSDIPENEKDHVALLFDGFELSSLTSILNAQQVLLDGNMNGTIILEDVLGKMGFQADATINELSALNTMLGTLELEANSSSELGYNMDMTIKGENVDLELAGNYKADATAARLDLQLDLNKVTMETVAGFSQEMLKDGRGYFSGNFDINGTTLEPVYDGAVTFHDAGINVAILNNLFTMDQETISINNDQVTLEDFDINDENGNTFTVDGTVGTQSYLNPTFNLTARADNFMALNSTAQDNDLYYGKAIFDLDARITGDLAIPVVKASIQVDKGTNVTYIIPPSELDIVQQEGIVQFVNKQNPDAILTQTEEKSATLTGFDINTQIKIEDGAVVTIVTDPLTNGELQVTGTGDLNYKMSPSGRMSLSGVYEVGDGYYQLNLYEIVTRRFEIVPGGTVRWNGDPFDAQVDVQALYRVETSASALMAAQTSGSDLGSAQQFRQELPFLVYLSVDGELMKPVISFRLDMPEEDQGSAGGRVYGRLQQLNDQQSSLNKQVFSLLVLNKFFPTSGADGSNGGTAAIARDNLNEALSDQLNQFGGQLLGDTGVDLSFGLDSYTDYQGSNVQDRTQLEIQASKKLLDDRLIVNVGSNVDIEGSAADGEGTPVIGNVSIEYLITEQGRWRIKGFRRNQFDNVVDGQLIISGVALIFTREFNEFKNLFKKSVDEARADADKKERLDEREKREVEEKERVKKQNDQKKKS